ncbi:MULTISPECIES: dihydrodipicolinate synthase family protein [Clostridium]|uniref:2-keto-3-deoxy-galactonate aldolase YagE n=3 Tax=Clostridium TaxID=1485 RepID=D8GK49_CLOLD|nr:MULTISPECIES: dihydrodipicolinate synthase family protein [Clostridium]ADK13167.1 predicted pyruvate-dependent class I aldolase [Clostridium ljungdahlii DSM 13528]AGY76391.1 dihydrodipicolinate synthase family protein [Clostridium autoethanogenum DSM 10061]ALU36554.1 Dihydrodipicolinate synthetase [Clostridium autoethanogenum DSM 10061]OAA84406.1 putative 2-keto-3-deoxy-galactonate aldolase YagE [Clostridium ljungdahlii DSM 13528]OVY48640.1 putative 2-keto-3-deoxy-galactonate aldolase YagE 
MKKARFITPVVTAFDTNGNLDIQVNKNIYDYLISAGIDGLLIMGSSGEFYAMSTEQRKELIDLAISYVNKRTKLIIGTGCMTIEDTIELSNYAIDAGADDIIIISPYYFSLTDESLEYYYGKVAESVKGNIYLYNYPDRTGHDLSPELTLNLLRKHSNIVGYKDTVSEMGHTRKLIQTVQNEFPDFEVFSGFDENFVRNILSGGSGCISALSNLYPEIFVDWVKAVNEKNMDKAAEIQNCVDKLAALYEISKCFIPIVKKAMMLKGLDIKDYCKTPLLKANEKQTNSIKKLIKEIDHIISK